MVVMVTIGGFGTVLGPVIGAIAITLVSEWLRSNYPGVHPFILGGLIITTIILLPQGLSTYMRDAVKTREFSLLNNVRRYRL
jgi:branched-chain amino acid transport system permease protein